ncbi:MAG: hypothetical protein RSD76_08550, partial [Clostridia bacterium]
PPSSVWNPTQPNSRLWSIGFECGIQPTQEGTTPTSIDLRMSIAVPFEQPRMDMMVARHP